MIELQIFRQAFAKAIAAWTRSSESAKELRMVFNKSQHFNDQSYACWTTPRPMILFGVKDYYCQWLTRGFRFVHSDGYMAS